MSFKNKIYQLKSPRDASFSSRDFALTPVASFDTYYIVKAKFLTTLSAISFVWVAHPIASAATVIKDASGTDLNASASWGGISPTAADVASWTSTSLTSGLTLGADVTWLGISFNGASAAVDVAGSGKLTLGASGIDMKTAGVDAAIANPIELSAAQTWAVATGRMLQSAGQISGTTALTVGAPAPTANYSGYLSAAAGTPTTVFPNTSLASIVNAGGIMNGGWIGGSKTTTTYFFTNNGTTATYQLQFYDGTSFTKVAKVQLTQSGPDVVAYQVYAKYKSGNLLGQNFDNITSDGAPPVGSGGYGVESTSAVLGSSPSGIIVLSGNNTFTAPVNVTSGTLRAGSTTAFGNNAAVTLNNSSGVTLDLNNFSNSIGSLSGGGSLGGTLLLGSATLTVGGDNTSPAGFLGTITGPTGSLVKTGTGTLSLSPTTSNVPSIVISSGTISTANGNFGTASIVLGDSNTAASPTALLTTGASINQPITVGADGTGTATIGGTAGGGNTVFGGLITLNRPTTLTAGSTDRTTYTGNIAGNVGTLTITGGRRTVFDLPTKTFAGNIVVTGTGTTFQTGVASGTEHVPNTASVQVDAGTFFKLAGAGNGIETIDALSGSGTVRRHEGVAGTQTLVIGSANGSATFSGILENGAGPLALTKSGTGTQTLTGINTYTGATAINAGTLKLGTGGSINNSASILVSAGALFDAADTSFTLGTAKTLIAGDNNSAADITGSLTSEGIIRPGGNNALGIISGLTNLTLGGTLDWDRSANSTASDSFAINGSLTISPGFIFNPSAVGFPIGGAKTYTIVSGLTTPLTTTDIENLALLPVDYAWDTTDATALKITHTQPGANLVWKGNISATWDTAATNWNNGSPGAVYADGDYCTFDDSAAEKSIEIPADVSPGAILVNNSFGNDITFTSDGGLGIVGTAPLIKSGTGKLVLLSSNIYTGGTTLSEGTISFDNGSLSTSGPILLDGGTLQWVLGNSQDLSANITFVNGKTPVFDTNDNDVIFATGIGNSSSSGIKKIGLGSLTLSGTGTYTGATEILQGTLSAGSNTALGSSTILIGTSADDAAIMLSNRADISNNVTVSASGSGDVIIGATNTGSGANAATYLGTITLNRPTIFSGEVLSDRLAFDGKITGNAGTLTFIGGSRTTLFNTTNDFVGTILITGGGTVLQASVGTTAEVIPNATDVSITDGGTLQLSSSSGAETIDSLNGDASSFVQTHNTGIYGSGLIIGSDNGDGTFAGVMRDGGTNNPLSLTKTGTGTQVLSGFNVNTGNTIVTDGTLELVDNAALTFRITNTTSNTLTGSDTVVLNGNFAINVSAFNLTTPQSWVLENADSLLGAYGATFQVVTPQGTSWEDAGSDTWTLEQGNYLWTFVETTGTLSVAVSPYGQWALANASGQAANLDHDNDGMNNALEFFMGATGNSFTPNPAPNATNIITWPKDANYSGTYGVDYFVETSNNLIDWTPITSPNVTINANTLQYTLPSNASPIFTRLKVIIP